jgi:tetratricopeptide (TPR) repeat protein
MNPETPSRRHFLAVLIVAAAVFTVFAASVHFPFTDWDDPHYVTENPDIRGFSWPNVKAMITRPWAIYVPLTLFSYAFDYELYGLDPFGYHLTNVVLHLANAVLVYGLVFVFTGEWAVALATALFFGVHPVQVESVVWVAERKNVLSAFWLLLSLAALVSRVLSPPYPQAFAKAQARGGPDRTSGDWPLGHSGPSDRLGPSAVPPAPQHNAVCFILYVLACLSKPSVVVFPLLLWAGDQAGMFGPRRERSWKFYVPFVAVSIVFAWLTILITGNETRMVHYGGSLWGVLRVMPVIFMKYLELLLFPVDLRLLYDLPVYSSFLHPRVLASLAGLAVFAAGMIWAYFRERKLFFWAAWFVIFLLPVLQFVPFPSLMNDRYLYLPLIGFFAGFFLLLKRSAGVKFTVAAAVLAGGILIGLNLHRQSAWRELPQIWLETRWWFQPISLKEKPEEGENPDMVRARRHLFEEDQPDLAIEAYQKILADTGDARAWDGLGIAYFKKGNLALAVGFLRKAVEMSPGEPGFYTNLALAYMPVRDFKSAYEAFLRAVELDPRNPVFSNNLGCFLDSWGKADDAEKAFRMSLRSDPDFAPALFNLGNLYFRLRKWDEARQVWRHLIEAHPEHEMAPTLRAQIAKLPQ